MSKNNVDDYELIEYMRQYIKDFAYYANNVGRFSTFIYVSKKDFNIIKSALLLLNKKNKEMKSINPDKIREKYKVKKIIKHGKRRGVLFKKQSKSFKVKGRD